MRRGQGAPPYDSHKRLDYSGKYFRFENENKPRIEFTNGEVVIGCKRITRVAFEELHRRYQEYLGNRTLVIQEGSY